MEISIQQFKNQHNHLRQRSHDIQHAIKHLVADAQKMRDTRATQSLWEKIKTSYSYHTRLNDLEDNMLIKKHELRRCNSELETHKRKFLTDFASEQLLNAPNYNVIEPQLAAHGSALSVKQSANKTIELARRALSEISDADSAVTSAQAFEVFDMFSSNKGVSVASSLVTSSASSEISEASSAIKAFSRSLDAHSALTSKITDPMTLEFVDLVFDVAGIDLGFDFTSVMSFFALNSASTDLSAAESQIRKTLPALESQLSQASDVCLSLRAQLVELLKDAYQPMIDNLLSAGIEVTESEFKSLIDSSMSGGAL